MQLQIKPEEYRAVFDLLYDDGEPAWLWGYAKWDGCVELRFGSNGATRADKDDPAYQDNIDYLHICDLPALIKALEGLRQECDRLFDAEGAYRNE